jgi:3-dehydro-L-gulonate 2-dehydrogenase
MLSGGKSTYQLPNDAARESRVSQVFLAIDPSNIDQAHEVTRIADGIIADLHNAPRAESHKPIRYPGEKTLQLREENLRLGVPLDSALWHQLEAGAF